MSARTHTKRQELEEALHVLWDEIIGETQEFLAALTRLHKAERDSEAYDEQWGRIAAALYTLKLKAEEAYRLMERVEKLEAQTATQSGMNPGQK